MTLIVRLLVVAVLVLVSGQVVPARADIIDDWATVQAPPPPKLEEVTVDPKTTALLMVDFLKQDCGPSPRCTALLPKVQVLLAAAREKHAQVVYTKFSPATDADILPPVAPVGDEPVVNGPLDKFLQTDLDKLLKTKQIKTVIVIGAASNGAVLFSAASALLLGYQVVIPVDGISGAPYGDQSTVYNFANAPVLGGKIKLTRISMVKF